jgi:hypothetical protein
MLRNKILLWFSILLFSFFLFAMTFGWPALNPTFVEWLYKNDGMNHYLGWLFYRQEPWSLPLGKIHRFIEPIGSSVTQTDSIPVMAIFFKMFHSYLPDRFQYFGLWHVLIWILQGYAALKVAQYLKANVVQSILIIFLFMWSPIIFFRTDHHALTAQFGMVISIYYFLFTQAGGRPPFVSMLFTLAFTSLVHPYLVAMILPHYFATYLRAALDHPSRTMRYVGELAFHLFSVVIIFWQLAIFDVKDSGDLGFGSISADLLTYFNPMHTSSILPRLRSGWGQYEGYAYLGFGMITLFLSQLYWFYSHRKPMGETLKRAWPLVLALLLIWMFSLSNLVTFGGNIILNLDFIYSKLGSIPGTFRSSGRFTWPLYYFIFFVLIWSVMKRWKPTQATVILFMVSVLQVLDVGHYYSTGIAGVAADVLPFREDIWKNRAGDKIKSMVVIPPALVRGEFDCGRDGFSPSEIRGLAVVAGELGWTINSGYSSRIDSRVFEICSGIMESLPKRFLRGDNLFVIHPKYQPAFREKMERFNKESGSEIKCQMIQGFQACW